MSAPNAPDQTGDLPRIGKPATTALFAAGITTLADLSKMSRTQLSEIHGVGSKALRLLDAALEEKGLPRLVNESEASG